MAENIRFNIELNRVLEVLCTQIYDSPLALLRENVQNAYDAILMRKAKNENQYEPYIKVTISGKQIIIEDNGIGMDSDALKKHYWSAGSSGKNNDEARKAGVVGTFGIGAMANFGVCKSLKVVTQPFDSDITYTSSVDKNKLSLNDECISIEECVDSLNHCGTQIIANLDNGVSITLSEAREYLSPYVQYLQIPVYLNNDCISLEKILPKGSKSVVDKKIGINMSFDYEVRYNEKANAISPQIYMYNLVREGKPVEGCMLLKQTQNNIIYGLRNYFGLAPIPISSVFNLGGIVNLPTLVPTAGREAVSRESIDDVASIVKVAEKIIAEVIAKDEWVADNSRELIQYIRKYKEYGLAGNICISAAETLERYRLKECKDTINGKQLYYYEGSDKTTIQNITSGNNIVLQLANDFNRHQVQLFVLKQQNVKLLPDEISVTRIKESEYEVPQISIISKIAIILRDDYFLSNTDIFYGNISHDVNIYVRKEDTKLCIYLNKESSDIKYLTGLYETAYGYFEPMVKDFVRSKIYPKISQYVPSSVRGGADALYNILQRNKELYTIESSELGPMEEVINDYREGKTDFQKVLKMAKKFRTTQTVSVDSSQVGDISDDFSQHIDRPEVIKEQKRANNQVAEEFYPLPPILRQDVNVSYKVLIDKAANATINGYSTFLAVSNKMFEQYYDFFLYPHTTRIIWSMHKIIYIFTHMNSDLTLYYDIELEKKLDEHKTGGKEIKSSTIITKNKIFVPVINQLAEYFNISAGKLNFTVRFDVVNN
ncbi:MAG: ATP-binding protein [Paludibacteraceae bacterium]|nr:ATP-binding protein [Paludibacteraceae bacterium]